MLEVVGCILRLALPRCTNQERAERWLHWCMLPSILGQASRAHWCMLPSFGPGVKGSLVHAAFFWARRRWLTHSCCPHPWARREWRTEPCCLLWGLLGVSGGGEPAGARAAAGPAGRRAHAAGQGGAARQRSHRRPAQARECARCGSCNVVLLVLLRPCMELPCVRCCGPLHVPALFAW